MPIHEAKEKTTLMDPKFTEGRKLKKGTKRRFSTGKREFKDLV